MMKFMGRILAWTRFTLTEYGRSGRILIELTLSVALWGLFLQKYTPTFGQLFSLTGLYSMALSLYTTTAMLGLGDRAQSYLVLARPLGRRGFLLGLYLAAITVVWSMVGLILALTALVNRPAGFGWLALYYGALPILLNVALLSALMLLLSSLVVSHVPRLVLLAVLAIALYSNTWNLSPVFRYLSPLQALFSRLVEPAIAGQRLAVSRDYSGGNSFVLLSQIALTVLLVGLALLSFGQRELILGKK